MAIPATRRVPDTSGSTPHAYGLMPADHLVPVKNSTRADLEEELDRLEGKDEDDAGGRHDPERRRQEQQGLDDPFGHRPLSRQGSGGGGHAMRRSSSRSVHVAYVTSRARIGAGERADAGPSELGRHPRGGGMCSLDQPPTAAAHSSFSFWRRSSGICDVADLGGERVACSRGRSRRTPSAPGAPSPCRHPGR